MGIFTASKKETDMLQPAAAIDYLNPLGFMTDELKVLEAELRSIPVFQYQGEIRECDNAITSLQEQLKTFPGLIRKAVEDRNPAELQKLKTDQQFCELDIAKLRKTRAELESLAHGEYQQAVLGLHGRAQAFADNYKAQATQINRNLGELSRALTEFLMILNGNVNSANNAIERLQREKNTAADEYNQAFKVFTGGHPN